jgi:hypothetical protein
LNVFPQSRSQFVKESLDLRALCDRQFLTEFPDFFVNWIDFHGQTVSA